MKNVINRGLIATHVVIVVIVEVVLVLVDVEVNNVRIIILVFRTIKLLNRSFPKLRDHLPLRRIYEDK